MIIFHMSDGTLLVAEEGGSDDPIRVPLGMSAVIRRWGTTMGRGQLGLTGPTPKTIIDIEPPGGSVNWLHVRRSIAVTAEAREQWLRLLSGKK